MVGPAFDREARIGFGVEEPPILFVKQIGNGQVASSFSASKRLMASGRLGISVCCFRQASIFARNGS